MMLCIYLNTVRPLWALDLVTGAEAAATVSEPAVFFHLRTSTRGAVREGRGSKILGI